MIKRGMFICVFILAIFIVSNVSGADTPENVLENVPYRDQGMGSRKIVDEKPLLIMQAALKPGQSVPQHTANSNVKILVLKGSVVINLDGKEIGAREGAIVPVAFKTPMNIKNLSDSDATFLIIKTPNPTEMPGE
jgi:quercetin dioxygenase-like cupin family protein